MPQEDATTNRPAGHVCPLPGELESARRAYDPIKRLIDLTAAVAGLLATAPVLLLVAGLIRLTSKGPVFYRAWRAGRGGEPFEVLKLRTMVEFADRRGEITAVADSRITPIGRFLRRTRLDELPQLWNILRGEMSLVGPRPESWSIVEDHFTPVHRSVLAIRPGLTCPGTLYHYLYQEHLRPAAGVNADELYVSRLLDVKIAADLHYVHHRTLLYDLRLLWETGWVMALKMLGIEPRWQPPISVPPAPDVATARKGRRA